MAHFGLAFTKLFAPEAELVQEAGADADIPCSFCPARIGQRALASVPTTATPCFVCIKQFGFDVKYVLFEVSSGRWTSNDVVAVSQDLMSILSKAREVKDDIVGLPRAIVDPASGEVTFPKEAEKLGLALLVLPPDAIVSCQSEDGGGESYHMSSQHFVYKSTREMIDAVHDSWVVEHSSEECEVCQRADFSCFSTVANDLLQNKSVSFENPAHRYGVTITIYQ